MSQCYRSLKSELPREYFKPQGFRLFSIIFLLLLGFGLIATMVVVPMAWFFKIPLSLIVGYCWAVNGLLGHELMHGSIVRKKSLQNFFGFFCFLPFMISPTFWRYWHNNLHHSHTQRNIMDPDAYPTYRIYKQSRFMQWMFPFTPGSGYKRSYLYFFFWFTFNVQVAQFYFRFRNRTFDKLDHKKVNKEIAVLLSIHLLGLVAVGPMNWFWVCVIPFLVQNYIPFSYISTNHNLSPLTKENDPLVNSLTVTNHPILEFLHVQFGYHVEHHLFPTVSGVHLKSIHKVLKERYPEKYLCMPKWRAIKALYKTARIYKNPTTLYNPITGATYPTLVARTTPAQSDQSTVIVSPEPLSPPTL